MTSATEQYPSTVEVDQFTMQERVYRRLVLGRYGFQRSDDVLRKAHGNGPQRQQRRQDGSGVATRFTIGP
jgi:hypothetical protein